MKPKTKLIIFRVIFISIIIIFVVSYISYKTTGGTTSTSIFESVIESPAKFLMGQYEWQKEIIEQGSISKNGDGLNGKWTRAFSNISK
jgi:cell shape-determining protein MreC